MEELLSSKPMIKPATDSKAIDVPCAASLLSYLDLKNVARWFLIGRLEGRWPRPLGLEGIEAIMFRHRRWAAAWESELPQEVLRLPVSWREWMRCWMTRCSSRRSRAFSTHMGQPSTPMECYVRLMFLKFRYRLGYESLCAEVSDSISWRRFCRIPLEEGPHPTTLMKLTTRCGSRRWRAERGVAGQAARDKLLRTARVRADTTVIAAMAYPTDRGCWPGLSAASPRPGGGSMPPGLRPPDPGARHSRAAGRRTTRSPRGCGRGPRRPGMRSRPRWPGSPASSPAWPGGLPRDAARLLANARRALRRADARAGGLAAARPA